MKRVYDDEDNEPMDDSLFEKDVYGIFHEIRKVKTTWDDQRCAEREVVSHE